MPPCWRARRCRRQLCCNVQPGPDLSGWQGGAGRLRRRAQLVREMAAEGYVSAMRHLGMLYEKGHGVTADLAEAQRWYEKAAAEGDEDAKKNLARLKETLSKN